MKLEFKFSRLWRYGSKSVIPLPCAMCIYLGGEYTCKRVSPSFKITEQQSFAGVCPDIHLNNRAYRRLL